MVIDAEGRVNGEHLFLAPAPRVNVIDKALRRPAGAGHAHGGREAAKRATHAEPPPGVVQKPDPAAISLVDAGGVFNGGKALVLDEYRLALPAARGGSLQP